MNENQPLTLAKTKFKEKCFNCCYSSNKTSTVTHSWARSDYSPLITRRSAGREILVVKLVFVASPLSTQHY